jgi:hypothetical protein
MIAHSESSTRKAVSAKICKNLPVHALNCKWQLVPPLFAQSMETMVTSQQQWWVCLNNKTQLGFSF